MHKRVTAISGLFHVQMTLSFGKWLAWLVGWFGILSKKWGSYWKNGVFADLPKKGEWRWSEGQTAIPRLFHGPNDLKLKIYTKLEKVTRFTGFWMGSPSLSTVCSSPKHFTLEKLYSFSYYFYAGGWNLPYFVSIFWLPLQIPSTLWPSSSGTLQEGSPTTQTTPHTSRPLLFPRTSAHKANLHAPFLGNPFGMSHK